MFAGPVKLPGVGVCVGPVILPGVACEVATPGTLVFVGVANWATIGVFVAVAGRVPVGVCVGVCVRVGVGVLVGLLVGVAVAGDVGVGVGVLVLVGVGVIRGVGVFVGAPEPVVFVDVGPVSWASAGLEDVSAKVSAESVRPRTASVANARNMRTRSAPNAAREP